MTPRGRGGVLERKPMDLVGNSTPLSSDGPDQSFRWPSRRPSSRRVSSAALASQRMPRSSLGPCLRDSLNPGASLNHQAAWIWRDALDTERAAGDAECIELLESLLTDKAEGIR